MYLNITMSAAKLRSGASLRGAGRLACICLFALPAARAVCQAGVIAGAAPPLNVVLISLNSLRADHLKSYGYRKDTAPNITRFAEGAAVFEQAIAQSHWTLPSLASLFTSKYVHTHGVYERGGRLSEKELTLAETLKMQGYRTAAFTGGLDMAGIQGLEQGFDVYFDDTGKTPMGSFKEIMPRALKWLSGSKNGRFFLFIDSYDIHPPWDKPEPGGGDSAYAGILKGLRLDYNLLRDCKSGVCMVNGKEERLAAGDFGYINLRYDAGIRYADRFIGELLAKIEEMKLSEKTVIIITSEHGEELSDHGSFDRFGRKNLYEEVIRVPLIVKCPGINSNGSRVASQVQLIDIIPTILDLLGIPAVKEAQGVSLVPLLERGGQKDFNRYVYSEAGVDKWAVRATDWKLIYEKGNYELFNLVSDRSETENIAPQKPAVVYELVQKLLKWRRKTKTDKSPDDTRLALTEEMKRKLKEAGYWR